MQALPYVLYEYLANVQEMKLTLGVSAAPVGQTQVPGLRSVDAVEGAKCANSKRRASCWSCSTVWRIMRPVSQGSKFFLPAALNLIWICCM